MEEKKKSEGGKTNRVRIGVQGFDELIEGGVERNSVILVAGGTGTGKTSFCTQFLHYGAHEGGKGLYISFEEPPEQVLRHANSFCQDCKVHPEKSNIIFQKVDVYRIAKAVEASILKAKGELLIDVKDLPVMIPHDFKPDRIVVDSLPALSAVFKEEEYRYFVFKFFSFLKSTGATVLAITETTQDPSEFSRSGIEEFLGDGVVVLYNIKQGDIRARAVEILKMRGTRHKEKIVPFKITDKGIEVYPDQSILMQVE
ncbi:MAG: Flp pilus assembly complex ATPase component TadA [Candidatus Aenigmarchaeota archaeon]|nr:Flp pilus assembly complex ATPase component TadA [Candidatus Aenigmarchaeota archaeon]